MTNSKHLGKNWVHFDFAKTFGKPVNVTDDAAFQVLGSSRGKGRMLFLGLGTGPCSPLVWEEHVLPLELDDSPYVNEGIIDGARWRETDLKTKRPKWRLT